MQPEAAQLPALAALGLLATVSDDVPIACAQPTYSLDVGALADDRD